MESPQAWDPMLKPSNKNVNCSLEEPDGNDCFQFCFNCRSKAPKKVENRLVGKSGERITQYERIIPQQRRFLTDAFTTMVDSPWRWTLAFFCLSFYVCWLFFGFLYWFISYLHGDFDMEMQNRENGSQVVPCLDNVKDYTSCFLFSMETQTTIGYGFSRVTEQCPIAIMTLSIQCIIATVIEAFLVGIVFTKLVRPKLRAQAIIFSRNAVISLRDGQLCFMFRIGDMHKSGITGARIRAQFVQSRVTQEGEYLPYYQQELKVGVNHDEADLLFLWPVTVVHKITTDSPLYRLSAAQLQTSKLEIIAILEGTSESTNMSLQARSSYIPSEILWGYRFADIISKHSKSEPFTVDYSQFHNVYAVETPLCSSYELHQ